MFAGIRSKKYPEVSAKIVSDAFRIHIDSDIGAMIEKYNVQLDYELILHPMLDLETPIVSSITNIDSFINSDKTVVDLVRKRNGMHYAIVSRTIEGDDINLFFDLDQPVVNRYVINGVDLHISYFCGNIDQIRIRRRRKTLPVPIVVFLSSVVYDESSQRLTTDVSQNGVSLAGTSR